ncbi:hypothetical protein PAEPH01_1106 [Pancytospora epiphaga]|nr:hypothetical protein PAEPH01_1106 [Pancytospora epiphaga]
MQSVIPLKEHRKFNDTWAAILFTIFLLTVNTIVFLTKYDIIARTLVIMETGPKHSREMQISDILIPAVFNILLLITEIAITLVSLVYFPRAFIYISLGITALLPLLSILIIGAIGAFVSFISLIAVLLIYHFLIRPHMNYIVAMLHASAVILSQYIFKIMGVFILVNMVLLVQIVCVSFALFHNGVSTSLLLAFSLLIYWPAANAFYFLQVFVSGIIYGHINRCQQPENSVVKNSLVYSAYAFGSICFGSLLVGFVHPSHSYTPSEEKRDNRTWEEQEGGSTTSTVWIKINRFVRDFIETVIFRVNDMVFPYIALYGTDYKESVSLSFHEITAHNFRGVVTHSAIEYVLKVFLVAATIPIVIANIAIIFYGQMHRWLCATIFGIISVILYSSLTAMICDGVLALVYTRIEFSKAIDSYDPELGKIIDVENKMIISPVEEGE